MRVWSRWAGGSRGREKIKRAVRGVEDRVERVMGEIERRMEVGESRMRKGEVEGALRIC